jgi:hypothetical protein
MIGKNKRDIEEISTRRLPVMIDRDQYMRLREHSDSTGVPVARIVNRALELWLEAHEIAGGAR